MIADLLPGPLIDDLDDTVIADDGLRFWNTGDALRALHFRDLWDKSVGLKPATTHAAPLSAQIEFTQKCNLTCDFCYNDSGPTNSDELSPGDLRRVCAELRDFDLVEMIISGGEPLVRRGHMDQIFDSFRGSGVPVHLLTNGLLLTRRTLDWLARNNVVTIQVSLDGSDIEVHNRQRRHPNAWQAAFAGLARAHDAGFHTIVSCTLTRENADSVGHLIDCAYYAGADTVNVGDLITWGRAREWMPTGACTDEQFDAVAEALQERRERYQGLIDIRLAVSMIYYICQIRLRGQESVLIRGNGDVIPHCTLSGIVTGNIHDRPIADIWDASLAGIGSDRRLLAVLDDHEVVRTPRLGQLRCARKARAS